jgi:PAS domain S-box-containing protein
MIANTNELAQTLFEEAGDALFLFDPEDSRILEINPVAQRLSGMSRAELREETVETLFRSDVQGGVARLQRACKVTGVFHSQDGFYLRQRRTGTWVPVNLTVARLHARPKTLGLITARDVTERKRAETALRESEQCYRELFENANDFIYITDLEGKLTSVNAAGERITGYAREEMVGQNVERLIAPEFQALARRLLDAAVGQEGKTTYELEMVSKDGQRVPLEVSSQFVYRDSQRVGVHSVARDIRERRLLEGQLRQAQKMEAVGLLAGGIAHDFNNLLTVVTGYCEILLDDLPALDPSRPALCQINKSAERAAVLTRQLLAFSRRQVLQPVVIDLNALVSDSAKMLGRLLGEPIEIVTELDSHLSRLKTDPGQVDQALMNLAVNARDAMPLGGKLTIATANAVLDEKDIQAYPDARPGLYARLTVRDTGSGIDPAHLPHIFEPFFTTKEVGKGTGLGLAMVYGFVRQSGGHITVDSLPGRGTTFNVYLPALGIPDHAVSPASPNPQPPRGSETVLLVEDEESVRKLMSMVLQGNGYHVLEACHGLDALRICENLARPVDMLVTDVVMPRMGGRELAEQLVRRIPELKVLFVSGHADDTLFHGALAQGTPFLRKPFSPDVLALKVRELLDRQSVVVPGM